MKISITILLLITYLASFEVAAQKKKVVYLDTLGNEIDWESSIGIKNTGRYKLFWDESNKKIRYIVPVPTSKKEYDSLLLATEDRFVIKEKIDAAFEYSSVTDIKGVTYDKNNLLGKILVINFWFVGCGPCEVEMPELNEFFEKYHNNDNVVFLSFAKSKKAKVDRFLSQTEFKYPVIIMTDDLVDKHQIEAYPTNFIIDKSGNYYFASQGIGVGGVTIMENKLKETLKD